MKKKVSSNNEKKKGGKLVPALCNIIGVIILLAVILICVPLSLPKLFGYELFEVLSPSMTPYIPEGSVVISKSVSPEEIDAADVIVFVRDGVNVTHRVVENHRVAGEFITKGDANEMTDIDPVKYSSLRGLVVFRIPVIGRFMRVLSGTAGKIYMLCFACCGFMFTVLARRLRQTS